jgi:serine/threonine protein phosphatase 1
MSGTVYYAIGDIHGMAKSLAAMHALIRADHARIGGAARVIHLGDFVDRGPDSRAAVALAMAFEREAESRKDLQVFSLLGNHEQMLLDAYDAVTDGAEAHWMMNGGANAAKSYVQANGGSVKDGAWRDAVDPEHIAWMRDLPTMLVDEKRRLVFVHAGIDPVTYPDCKDEIRIWTRSPKFFDPDRWPDRPELQGVRVVHGHTPTQDFVPHVDPRRINIDTGAVYGGTLTCAVLEPGEPRVRYLQV